MLGAIIGDIVGSVYEVMEVQAIKQNYDRKREYNERIKIMDKNVPLFRDDCSYTDDSVLTIAVADALLHKKNFEETLKEYGLAEASLGVDKYGRSRFGAGFVKWLHGFGNGDSFGNGAAMRISSVGYYFDDLESIYKVAKDVTVPSHNHEEAICGARAIATSIYLARTGCTKEEIKKYVSASFGYNLEMNLEILRREYRFSSRAVGSVPQAIYCFLESNDFEDAIRKAISIGGDTDTIAAMCGGIAEAFYGIPKEIKEEALTYLPSEYKDIVLEFYKRLEEKSEVQSNKILIKK